MSALADFLVEHYTETEVAAALGISIVTLRGRRARGTNHPPFIKVGLRTFYPKKEFHAWVKKIKIVHPVG